MTFIILPPFPTICIWQSLGMDIRPYIQALRILKLGLRTYIPTCLHGDTQDIETRMISSYFDPNGILWIGTHGGGIIISDRRWDIIKRYQQNCDNETNSIITDSSDRIYLATYHKGIMRSTKSFCPSDSTLQFVTIPIPQLEPTYFLCRKRQKRLAMVRQ